MIKLKIREHSIKYATAKKVKISRREEQLEKEINTLQHLIDSNEINTTDRADVFNSLENKRRELESIIEYKTKGSILRARCRWFNDFLINSYNCAYLCGHLSVSQKRGIIKLIPKHDSELYFVKNWRPISLLNCDYKIAAKAIANRLKRVLPRLIDHGQTGFLKGRFIGENIRLVDATIKDGQVIFSNLGEG